MAFLTQHLKGYFVALVDPSLKGRHHPTFLCKFLLGRRWEHKESPASFGTVWPSSPPICSCLCHRSLTRCLYCCQQQGTWQSVGSQHLSEELTMVRNTQGGTSQWWPMYKTCAWGFGVAPQPASLAPKPFWLTADVQCKPNYGNTFFFSRRGQ